MAHHYIIAVMKISAAIITKNEEKSLPKCIASIRDVVDEVIVVDSGSTDNTLKVARELADVVEHRDFDDFSSQRNYAASNAKNAWIFMIDADEQLTDELKQRIWKIKREEKSRYQAYCFPRMTFDRDGKMLFNIVSYPGFHFRLYHRDFCQWHYPVHETLEVHGKKKFCPEHLLHYPDYDRVPDKLELYK